MHWVILYVYGHSLPNNSAGCPQFHSQLMLVVRPLNLIIFHVSPAASSAAIISIITYCLSNWMNRGQIGGIWVNRGEWPCPGQKSIHCPICIQYASYYTRICPQNTYTYIYICVRVWICWLENLAVCVWPKWLKYGQLTCQGRFLHKLDMARWPRGRRSRRSRKALQIRLHRQCFGK